MATHKINKIVRGNLNLKPWILSKNPTDIVNGYVQRLYKQIPENFKAGLFKSHCINNSPENRHRIRVTPERFTIPIVNIVKPKPRGTACRSPPSTPKTPLNRASKMFKSPSFKIYNTRKYGSTASSSSASIFRTNCEERRKKIYKPASGIGTRTYLTTAATSSNPQLRYTAGQVNSIANSICKDLMPIDNRLKRKIRPFKPPMGPMQALDIQKPNILKTSLMGWNHPSKSHLSKLTAPLVFKKAAPPARSQVERLLPTLMPVNRKPCEYKWNQLREESERLHIPMLASNMVPKRMTLKPELPKRKIELKKSEPRMDFVCRSRPSRARLAAQRPSGDTTWQMFRNLTGKKNSNKNLS